MKEMRSLIKIKEYDCGKSYEILLGYDYHFYDFNKDSDIISEYYKDIKKINLIKRSGRYFKYPTKIQIEKFIRDNLSEGSIIMPI